MSDEYRVSRSDRLDVEATWPLRGWSGLRDATGQDEKRDGVGRDLTPSLDQQIHRGLRAARCVKQSDCPLVSPQLPDRSLDQAAAAGKKAEKLTDDD
jgi:hypothetical protein